MRLNIRLCITVALFAAVQPATASEFNQVIEDFDRYIQTEKASGNFPVSVQQPGRSPETRVTPPVNTAGKATQSQRQGTRKAARTGKRTVSSAQESRTQTAAAQKTDTTTPGISVPAQCENIVVREPVVVTNPVPIGYPQWSPAYLVRDSQKWGGNHRGFVFSPVPSRMTSSLTLTPEALFAIPGEPFRSMTYFSDLPLTVARVLKPETWFTPSDPQKQLRLTRLKLQDVKRELASLNEKYRNVQHNYEQALADIAKKETELSNLTLANNELQTAAKSDSAKLTAELEQNRKTIDSLNQQISENLARFGQAEGQVTALTAEKASLEKQIAALNKEKVLADKNLALLESKNADMAKITQKLTELEKQLAQRDAEKQQLNDKILALTGEYSKQSDALKKDLTALAAEKAALEKQGSRAEIR
ncbi:DUF1202 family protein [Morganella morganii]